MRGGSRLARHLKPSQMAPTYLVGFRIPRSTRRRRGFPHADKAWPRAQASKLGGRRLFFCKIKPLHGSGGWGYYGGVANDSARSARPLGVSLLVLTLLSKGVAAAAGEYAFTGCHGMDSDRGGPSRTGKGPFFNCFPAPVPLDPGAGGCQGLSRIAARFDSPAHRNCPDVRDPSLAPSVSTGSVSRPVEANP